jgi:hypothetical protein
MRVSSPAVVGALALRAQPAIAQLPSTSSCAVVGTHGQLSAADQTGNLGGVVDGVLVGVEHELLDRLLVAMGVLLDHHLGLVVHGAEGVAEAREHLRNGRASQTENACHRPAPARTPNPTPVRTRVKRRAPCTTAQNPASHDAIPC